MTIKEIIDPASKIAKLLVEIRSLKKEIKFLKLDNTFLINHISKISRRRSKPSLGKIKEMNTQKEQRRKANEEYIFYWSNL